MPPERLVQYGISGTGLSLEATHAGVRPMSLAISRDGWTVVLSEHDIRFLRDVLTTHLDLDERVRRPGP